MFRREGDINFYKLHGVICRKTLIVLVSIMTISKNLSFVSEVSVM
jgi:hypothetical protein